VLKENNSEKSLVENAFINAESYFKGLNLNDYQRGYFIDLYINAEKWNEADNLIRLNKEKNTFYYQKVCKIKRGKKLYCKALKNINLAIKDINKTPKFMRYLNVMYHDKAEVLYEAKKYEKALLALKKAIKLLKDNGKDDKLLEKWNNKLVQWQNVNKT
jgi:tetratricopeptide (TPR) repeat protein